MLTMLVTLLLTPQGDLVRSPEIVLLDNPVECRLLMHQREFLPPPGDAIASFSFCEAVPVS